MEVQKPINEKEQNDRMKRSGSSLYKNALQSNDEFEDEAFGEGLLEEPMRKGGLQIVTHLCI